MSSTISSGSAAAGAALNLLLLGGMASMVGSSAERQHACKLFLVFLGGCQGPAVLDRLLIDPRMLCLNAQGVRTLLD
jgi:hypothetical protein